MSLERAQLALLAALTATVPLSIFASEAVFLSLSLLVLAARLLTRTTRIGATALDTPLVSLAVWTLLAASFARDPVRSHEDAKKLVLFALFYVAVEVLAREDDRERVLSGALLGGLSLATLMVCQHLFLGYDRLDRRPDGFLGHYMSASGVIMGVLLLAVGRLAFGPRARVRPASLALPVLVVTGVGAVAVLTGAGHGMVATRLWVAALAVLAAAVALSPRLGSLAAGLALPALTAPLAAWALVVSQTRSAWVGAVAGLGVLAMLRAPRLLWLLGAVLAAVLLARPASVTERLTIGDASSRDRYYMWQAGLDMVLDKPVFGQGPGMILLEYPRYRWPEATHPMQPHLHNNFLQIAAERGLPGLVFLLWWAAVALAAALREARRSAAGASHGAGWPAAGALAALGAVLVAGLFEYNLGDSEVLMLCLLLTAVPFALARERERAAVA